MKRYSMRVFTLFVLIFAFVFFIVTFFYNRVTEIFISSKITENVLYMNQNIAQNVEFTLMRDYEKLTMVVQKANYESINIIDALMNNQTLTINPIGFGEVKDNYFLIDGVNYYYNNDYLIDVFYDNQFDDYHQKIGIYEFKNGYFQNDEKFIFFNIENHLIFYSAKSYFQALLENVPYLPEHYYFILSKDGVIHFQKDNANDNDKIFAQYIRAYNSEEVVDQILSDLQKGNSNISRLKLFNNQTFLAYSPLNKDINERSFFIVYAYDYQDVIASMGYLNQAILTLSVFIFIFFIIVALVIYYLLLLKNSDIEMSRLRYYYSKPYVIKINKAGKIKSTNRAIKLNFPEIKNLRRIEELSIVGLKNELLPMIYKQQSFTVEINTKTIDKFLRFLPAKIMDGYYLLGEDITDYENEQTFNRQLALYNQTTQLPNHIVLKRDLKQLLSNKDKIESYALVITDINNFKGFNKLFGRMIGDEILNTYAKLVTSIVGEDAKLYNFEADQFGILFSNCETPSIAINYFEQIREQLKRPFLISNNQLNIDIKAGIFHFFRSNNLTPSLIYENAYIALKKSKSFHNKAYTLYDEGLSAFITKEQVLESDLHQAIKKSEFMLYLQPQYDNEESKIVSFEALIRWNNPKYRLQSPAHFIEVAEQNNMIIQIGNYVMHETFRLAKALEPYNVRISMNVSPIQLLQAGFVNEIVGIAEEFGLRKGAVAIEITETFLMNNFDSLIQKLHLLKEYGFSIHLDDFGTGYSSMLYLKNLPIDTIKIDREFIRYVNTDRYSRAIVSKIVSLAKNLELDVIAEGVEDEKQNQFLIRSGCKVIQGHLISPAVPYEQAVKLLNEYNIEQIHKVRGKKN